MELVYLWVEDYKNIKKQGFNLSSNFECSFENETLKVVPKKTLSIFEDTSIMALVGKNGAGKSSIQKLIFLLIFLKKYENITSSKPIDSEKRDAIIEIFRNSFYKNKNIFLIINTDSGLKKLSLLQIINNYDDIFINVLKPEFRKCILEANYTELKPEEIKFFCIHFHYMIDSWFDGYHTADDWTLKLYHRVDGFETPLLLEPYKGHTKDNQYIDISNIEYLNNQHIFDFYGELTEKLKFNKFFNPNYIWMMIDSNKLISKFKKFDGFPIEDSTIDVIEKYISKLCKIYDLQSLNKIYLLIKIVHTNNSSIFTNQKIIEELRNKIVNINSDSSFKKVLDEFSFDGLLKLEGLNETKKLEACIEFNSIMTSDVKKLEKYKNFLVLVPSKHKTHQVKEIHDVFDKILPWIVVEFYEEKKGYNSLSSGEKSFLNFAMNLLYQITNIKRNGNYETVNLFLDEVEYSMHPEWQREFLKQTLILLKHFVEIKFNLFFATHSPFLLSDIPKRNIMFLDNGKQVEVDINPFGANIHTLLSHGFFMKDGLMGEFAKSKIDDVIKYLNNDKDTTISSDKDAQNIISIIGEPIIKRELQRMLKNKMELSNKEEIDTIKEEIKVLSKKLNKLEGKE